MLIDLSFELFSSVWCHLLTSQGTQHRGGNAPVITFVGFGFMFLFWASSHRCFVLASRIRPFGHTLLLAFFYRPAPWSRAPSPFWPSASDFRLCLGSVEARPEFCLLTGFSFNLLMIFLRSLARQPRFLAGIYSPSPIGMATGQF
jgi:hypothetical protein